MSPILYRMIADGSETCEGPTGYGDGIGGYPIGQYGKKNITSDKLSSYLMKDPFDEDLDLLMEKKVSGTGETNEWNNKGTSPIGSDTGIIGNKMKTASNYAGITAGISTKNISTKNIFGEALPNMINRTQSNGSWDGFDDASKDYNQYDLDQLSTRARKNSKNIRHLDIEFETLNEREEREKQEALQKRFTATTDICNYLGIFNDIFDYVGELAWYATKKCLKISLLCFILALVWESSSDLIEPLLWRGINSFSPLLAWKLARALDGDGPITMAPVHPSQWRGRRQLDSLEEELLNHHLDHVASLEAEKKHKEEQLKSLDALIQSDIKEGKIVIPNDQGDVQNNTQNNKDDNDHVQNNKGDDVQNDKSDVQNDKGDNTQNQNNKGDESQNDKIESQMGFLDEVKSSTHKFNLEPVSDIIRNTTPTHGTELAGF